MVAHGEAVSQDTFATDFVRLMDQIKAEVGDIPPGHERNKKCLNVGEWYLSRARTQAERNFFTGVVNEFKRSLAESAREEEAKRRLVLPGPRVLITPPPERV